MFYVKHSLLIIFLSYASSSYIISFNFLLFSPSESEDIWVQRGRLIQLVTQSVSNGVEIGLWPADVSPPGPPPTSPKAYNSQGCGGL